MDARGGVLSLLSLQQCLIKCRPRVSSGSSVLSNPSVCYQSLERLVDECEGIRIPPDVISVKEQSIPNFNGRDWTLRPVYKGFDSLGDSNLMLYFVLNLFRTLCVLCIKSQSTHKVVQSHDFEVPSITLLNRSCQLPSGFFEGLRKLSTGHCGTSI